MAGKMLLIFLLVGIILIGTAVYGRFKPIENFAASPRSVGPPLDALLDPESFDSTAEAATRSLAENLRRATRDLSQTISRYREESKRATGLRLQPAGNRFLLSHSGIVDPYYAATASAQATLESLAQLRLGPLLILGLPTELQRALSRGYFVAICLIPVLALARAAFRPQGR